MKRDSGHRSGDDSPLANSDFFRQVENADHDDPQLGETGLEAVEELADELEAIDADADGDDYDPADDELFEEYDETPPPVAWGGKLLLVFGWLLGVSGAVLTALAALAPETVAVALKSLHETGVQPVHLLFVGIVIGLFGTLRSELDRRSASHAHDFGRLDDALERMEQAAHEHRERRSDEELDDSERVLLALERQDGKINNLTRATKLYGKPLVEISKQVAEVMSHVQDFAALGERIEAASEAAQRSATLLESLEDGLAGKTRELAEEQADKLRSVVDEQTGKLASTLERQDAKLAELSRGIEGQARPLGEVNDHIVQVEEHIEGLVRTAADLRNRLETVEKTVDKRFENMTSALGERPETVAPKVDFGGIEKGLDAMRREMQSIATRLAQIESRPVPTTPQSAAAPAPAATPAATPAAGATGGPAAGLAQSISGERQGPAKNVLGAIAKLKSMRG